MKNTQRKSVKGSPKGAAPELDEPAMVKPSARMAERAAALAAQKERERLEAEELENAQRQAAQALLAAAEERRFQEQQRQERIEADARAEAARKSRSIASEPNADVAVRERLAAQGIESLSGAPLSDTPDTVKIEPRRARPRMALPGTGRVPAYEPIPVRSRNPAPALPVHFANTEREAFEPESPAVEVEMPSELFEPAGLDLDHAVAPSKLRRIGADAQGYTGATPAQTLAHRLEAARRARIENGEVSEPKPSIAPSSQAQAIRTQTFEPEIGHVEPTTATIRRRAPKVIQEQSKANRSAIAGTRNAAVGFAVSYMEEFERHIGGPLISVWRNKGQFAMGILNVAAIFALTYFFAHVSFTSHAIFLEGGMLSRLGALCWLTVLCAFLWWALCLIGSRMVKAIWFDWMRFERIGSDYFEGSAKTK